MSSKIEAIALKLEMRNIVLYFGHSAAFCLVIITCSGICNDLVWPPVCALRRNKAIRRNAPEAEMTLQSPTDKISRNKILHLAALRAAVGVKLVYEAPRNDLRCSKRAGIPLLIEMCPRRILTHNSIGPQSI